MTKRTLCALVVVALTATAGAASADHRRFEGTDTHGESLNEPTQPGLGRPGPDIGSPDARERQPLTPGIESGRRLVGRVMDLDYDEGTVTLATERGMLVVQASPDELTNVAVGDFVVLRMAPETEESPSASPETSDRPQPAPCPGGAARCQ